MSDLLAIFGADDTDADAELLDAIAAYRPDRVTSCRRRRSRADPRRLGQAAMSCATGSPILMAAIERRTGATVVGLAGDRAQLDGWRFDRELGARRPSQPERPCGRAVAPIARRARPR